MTEVSRRAEITAEIVRRTGIDEAMIRQLVHRFYARVRDDSVLGPIFEERIVDWSRHLDRMCDFWSSVALMSGRYHGQAMQAHLSLPVHADHFDRWLNLFEETVGEVCPAPAAEHFMERARRIADSLELAIAAQRGVLLGKGQRFRPEAGPPHQEE